MSEFVIFNEDYAETVKRLEEQGRTVDVVLTSPPYNTNKKQGNTLTISDVKGKGYTHVRYDTVQDNMTNEQYDAFISGFVSNVGAVLSQNGVILLNLSYGNENPSGIWTAVAAIIANTEFTVADCIVWKKSNAMPNNNSANRSDRICEFVFVIVRKSELATFKTNKKVKSVRKTGQPVYGSFRNFVEAKNNDGVCPYNKATFSTDLVTKLLAIYADDKATVYDPFMGSGTTLLAANRMGIEAIGSEISHNQCVWAIERIDGDKHE